MLYPVFTNEIFSTYVIGIEVSSLQIPTSPKLITLHEVEIIFILHFIKYTPYWVAWLAQWYSAELRAGYQRLFLWRVDRPVREAVHSPPCSADDKNAWSYTSTPAIRLNGLVLGKRIVTVVTSTKQRYDFSHSHTGIKLYEIFLLKPRIAVSVHFTENVPVLAVVVTQSNRRELFSWRVMLSRQHRTFFFHYWAVGTSIGDVTYYKQFLPLLYLLFHQHSIKAKRGGRERKNSKSSLSLSLSSSILLTTPVVSPHRKIVAQILFSFTLEFHG